MEIFRPNQFLVAGDCQNCLLRGHTNISRNNSLQQNRLLNHLQNWVEIFQISNEFFLGVVKTELYETRGTICGKVLLFEKYAFSVNLAHWKKNFRPFFEFFSTQLSKLQSMCPKEHLKGKDFFPEKIVFFHQFGRLKQTFQPIVETFTAGLSNLRFTCPSKQFEGKSILRKLCFVDLQAWAKNFRHSV